MRTLSLFLFISIFIGNSCTNKKGNQINSETKYSSIEIYCWCFLHDRQAEKSQNMYSYEMVGCNPPASVSPQTLISQRNFLFTCQNIDTIKKLTSFIFDRKDSSSIFQRDYPDARFLILLKKNDLEADTLVRQVGYDPDRIYLNSKIVYHYSFEILDSIISVLNLSKIDCTSQH